MKLKDLYFQPYSTGIFKDMYNSFFKDFFDAIGFDIDTLNALDIEYIFSHSGEKPISVLLMNLLNKYVIIQEHEYVEFDKKRITWNGMLHDLDKEIIQRILKVRYLTKWKRLWDTVVAKYDFLSPYNMELNDKGKVEDSGNTTNKEDSTRHNDNSYNGSSQNSRWGYNSTDAVKDNKTDDNNSSNSDTFENKDINSTHSKTIIRDGTITRKGNIGNITLQQLTKEERDILQYQFIDVIYQDLDNVLTRNVYFD